MSNNNLQLEITNRQILKLALPISFALLVPQINFITNNIFLGQLGELELAAAGLTGVYYLIFAAIGFGLNNGLQALISRRAGENKVEEIGKLFLQGVLISMLIAASGILITYLVAPLVFEHTVTSSIIKEKSIEFLGIRIWGLPFLYIYQMRNALLVGINQSQYLIAGTVAETVANIFFDYTLIYGHFGFPRMGFNGAAVASIIAEAVGMFVVFIVIHYKGISKKFSLFKDFTLNKPVSRLILTQSAPLIFQSAISLITWEFFYILVEHHGERELAISNTMRNVFGFFGIFTWAFAGTTNTMVSNVMGQGKKELVATVIHKIVKISTGIAIIMAVIINLFPGFFLSIYGQGEGFIEDAIPVVRIVSSALILMSFGIIWLNAVTGTGNSKVVLIIEFITIVLYSIYVYLVLEVFRLPITVGWMSEWLYWISLFSLSYVYMKSGRWKAKVI